MPSTVKIVIALAVVGAVSGAMAAPSPAAAARVHHAARHHRHLHARHRAPRQPLVLVPGERPGYRYGGPLFSTCDRINADRMLVGTCR
jgi:Ni/Co efflux regulator RcnB